MSEKAPDWVMLGIPMPDGRFAIYASTELNHAELRHEIEEPDWITGWHSRIRTPGRTIVELTVNMRTYVIVTADSYAQAFDRLFAHWSPQPVRPEVTAAQSAIEAG